MTEIIASLADWPIGAKVVLLVVLLCMAIQHLSIWHLEQSLYMATHEHHQYDSNIILGAIRYFLPMNGPEAEECANALAEIAPDCSLPTLITVRREVEDALPNIRTNYQAWDRALVAVKDAIIQKQVEVSV